MSVHKLRTAVRRAQEAVGIEPILATDEQLQELALIGEQIRLISESLARLGLVPDVQKQERAKAEKLHGIQQKLSRFNAEKASRSNEIGFTSLAEDRAFMRKAQAELAEVNGDCLWWSAKPA